jgi:hypothetical protein
MKTSGTTLIAYHVRPGGIGSAALFSGGDVFILRITYRPDPHRPNRFFIHEEMHSDRDRALRRFWQVSGTGRAEARLFEGVELDEIRPGRVLGDTKAGPWPGEYEREDT